MVGNLIVCVCVGTDLVLWRSEGLGGRRRGLRGGGLRFVQRAVRVRGGGVVLQRGLVAARRARVSV